MCSPQVMQGVGSIFSQMGGFGNQSTGGFGGQPTGVFGNQSTGGFGNQQMGGFQPAFQPAAPTQQGYLPQYQAQAAQEAAMRHSQAGASTTQPLRSVGTGFEQLAFTPRQTQDLASMGSQSHYQSQFDAANAARPVSAKQAAFRSHMQGPLPPPQNAIGASFEPLSAQGGGFAAPSANTSNMQQALQGTRQGQLNSDAQQPLQQGITNPGLAAFGSRSLFG